MARISVYNEEEARYWEIDASMEQAVISGSHSGVYSYYIKMQTSETDPEGGSIPLQIIEDFPAVSNVTREIEDATAIMIAHSHGDFLSTSSSVVWRAESTQTNYSTSETKVTSSSVSSVSSKSSSSTSSATYSSNSDSSESSEIQGE